MSNPTHENTSSSIRRMLNQHVAPEPLTMNRESKNRPFFWHLRNFVRFITRSNVCVWFCKRRKKRSAKDRLREALMNWAEDERVPDQQMRVPASPPYMFQSHL